MSWHYIQVNDDGMVIGESWLAGEVEADGLISVDDDFDATNKRYVNGEWIDYIAPEPPVWEADIIDEGTEAQLEMQMNVQYLVDLAEINEEGI